MTRAERVRLKRIVNGGGIAWLLLMGWLMLATLPENAIQNMESSQVQARMDACAGTFAERYACKEKIIIEGGRETFYLTALRFLLVVVPPLAGSIWLSSRLNREPFEEDAPAPLNDGNWKARAQMHTQQQSPVEAAHALHLTDDQLPHVPPVHQTIDDIAPLPDWKAQASRNVHHHPRDDEKNARD